MVQFLFLSGLFQYFERYFNFGKHESKNLTVTSYGSEDSNQGQKNMKGTNDTSL